MMQPRGQPRPDRGGQRPSSQPPQSPSATLTPEDARRIVEEGNAELLVRKAQEIGRHLDVNPSQLRRFFGEVKRIEMLWSQEGQEARAQRRAVLLRPRLNYQVQRMQKVKPLQNVLEPCLHFAVQSRENFANFVEFYEALIAYAPKEGRGDRS
ncbi:hypothetical protein HRbin29_00267 [bacterium HR29]|nr:hypothetical protein HRbin29_00267 [bacterium HR29]